jgi:hypothetical protein
MTPFHPNFRRVLRRNIPQLSDKEWNRFEEFTALRHQLVQENRMRPDYLPPNLPIQDFRNDIAYATIQAQEIVGRYAKAFDASLRLWVARRRLALHQGNFLQMPPDRRRLKDLIAAIWNYRKVQLQTFPALMTNRIKYYFDSLSPGRVLLVFFCIALILACLFNFTRREKPDRQPNVPGQVQ